jgi:hypothetical protein
MAARVRAIHWTGWHELGLFALAYLAYFGIRAITQGNIDDAVDNAARIFHWERDLGVQWEQALQDAVLDRHTLVDVLNGIYIYGHWPVLIIGGIALFHLSRPNYVLLRNVCLVSGALGLVIFALFPVAPPRLTDLPVLDTITLRAGAYRSILPASLVNEYAAMPSFHAGWNLLLGILLFRASRHLLVRTFAVLMPLCMALAVVATANHFVLDVLVGVVIVLVSLWIVDRWTARRVPTLMRAEHGGEHDSPATTLRGGASGGERSGDAAPSRGAAGSASRGGGHPPVPRPPGGPASQDPRAGARPLGSLGARGPLDSQAHGRPPARRRRP